MTNNRGVGKPHLRIVQHSCETFSIGTAKRNAGIPLCLIKDKNTRARSITKQSFSSTRRMIILAQIVTLDSFNGMLGGLQLPFPNPPPEPFSRFSKSDGSVAS
ncbi:hypothetical protein [Bilophila wadsworthia]|uniref:hypothetical protein n=1 Tax=Bilophila wadsworthia TaxID=35833 RepID=UPI0035225ECB